MKKAKYKNLTQADFDQVKNLQGLGFNTTQTAGIVKRANSTVSVIYRSDTFEGYKEALRAQRKSQPAKQDPRPETADPLLERLDRIADNLERLAKAWEKSPKKKGLF